MKMLGFAASAAMAVALSGCATIVEGTTQSVSVSTPPEQGAQCTLVNSQGTWYVTSPGSTTVHKTKTDLDVTCNKPGYQTGHVVAASHFAATTAANVLAGGVIGLGVDAASGTNYYYNSPILVPLGPTMGGPATPSSATTPATSANPGG
jgi:ABC-type Fe3+-hydroxamate transport system substrate-binding protein